MNFRLCNIVALCFVLTTINVHKIKSPNVNKLTITFEQFIFNLGVLFTFLFLKWSCFFCRSYLSTTKEC